jgi:Leucine-rich repeat (LRR) protein
MLQILKRLELIKTSISLEDEEIIALQISTIKALNPDDDVSDILDKLNQHNYASAITEIESYLVKQTGLVSYADKEVQGLKLELKVLERTLQSLTSKKNECINDIENFNHEYSVKLGVFIHRLLELREDILFQKILEKQQVFDTLNQEYIVLKQKTEDAIEQLEKSKESLDGLDEFSDEYDEVYKEYQELKDTLGTLEGHLNEKIKATKEAKNTLNDDPVTQEFKEAKEDSEQFNEEYDEIIADEHHDLSKKQLKELKKAWKKAFWLCHPNSVKEELKEQAYKIMIELNSALQKKDLNKVLEVLNMLEADGFDIASDNIFDIDLLKKKILKTNAQIDELKTEIDELETSDTYKNIQSIDDKDEYFFEIKVQLVEELERLEKELNQLKGVDDSWMERLWTWADEMKITTLDIPRYKYRLMLLRKVNLFTDYRTEHKVLTYLPKEIGQLTNLTQLGLSNNLLTYLPKEIGQLTNLKQLGLSKNRLTELPKEIGQLTHLEGLNLDNNNLTELPKELWQLTDLQILDLGNNNLTELPKEIGQLTHLKRLRLCRNNLTELPKELWQLTHLQYLSLSGNNLTELPKEIGQLTHLTELDLSNGSFTELPKEIVNLTNLKHILADKGLRLSLEQKNWIDQFNIKIDVVRVIS